MWYPHFADNYFNCAISIEQMCHRCVQARRANSEISQKGPIRYLTKRSEAVSQLYSEIINPMRPRRNCRHFADGIFNCILLNENVWISIKIPLKFVRIKHILALVQIMACPLVGAIIWTNVVYFTDAYLRHATSMC